MIPSGRDSEPESVEIPRLRWAGLLLLLGTGSRCRPELTSEADAQEKGSHRRAEPRCSHTAPLGLMQWTWPREACRNASPLNTERRTEIPLHGFGGNVATGPNFCLAGHSRQIPMIDYGGISVSLTLNHNLSCAQWQLGPTICHLQRWWGREGLRLH